MEYPTVELFLTDVECVEEMEQAVLLKYAAIQERIVSHAMLVHPSFVYGVMETAHVTTSRTTLWCAVR